MPDEKCRALLKSGERCRYSVKEKGLCGLHRRAFKERSKFIKGLIKAGKISTAVGALIKFGEVVIPVVHHLQPMLLHVIAHKRHVAMSRAKLFRGRNIASRSRQARLKRYHVGFSRTKKIRLSELKKLRTDNSRAVWMLKTLSQIGSTLEF